MQDLPENEIKHISSAHADRQIEEKSFDVVRYSLPIAEKIRLLIEKHNMEGVPRVTASFGIANFKSNETLHDIINRADTALYEAKNKGRNKVVIAQD